jgi:hypothetical protein
MKFLLILFTALTALTSPTLAAAQPMSVDDFRRELIGVPLCGTPGTGPLAGRALCTVHLPDGSVIVSGTGILVRGVWDTDTGRVCRRNPDDPLERRRCVDYEKLGDGRYRNSDGVEACIGPCP